MDKIAALENALENSRSVAKLKDRETRQQSHIRDIERKHIQETTGDYSAHQRAKVAAELQLSSFMPTTMDELWARAYSQFVAIRSNYLILTDSVRNTLEARKERSGLWTQDEFGSILPLIEDLFRTRGEPQTTNPTPAGGDQQ